MTQVWGCLWSSHHPTSNQITDFMNMRSSQSNCFIQCVLLFDLFSDQCAQQDPPIGNVDKLIDLACTNYEYGEFHFLNLESYF